MNKAAYRPDGADRPGRSSVIRRPPSGAYAPTWRTKAVAQLKAAASTSIGKKWKAANVALTEGGK